MCWHLNNRMARVRVVAWVKSQRSRFLRKLVLCCKQLKDFCGCGKLNLHLMFGNKCVSQFPDWEGRGALPVMLLWIIENSSLLVEPERGAPDTPGGDHKTDVQDRGIGGGSCDVGEKGGQAEERGMDNEKCYQFLMSIWKLYSRSESPNTILYLWVPKRFSFI